MSCLSKINHAYSGLKKNQKNIADYILKNSDEVVRMSVQDLAKITDTSSAAIIRFAKKIGYEGYTSLKLELAAEVNQSIEPELFEDHPSLSGTFSDFLIQENKAYHNTVLKTFDLINPDTLEKVIDLAYHARRIYLVGIGASAAICSDLLVKLSRIDMSTYYFEDAHVQLANSIHITPDDLVIAISYRGNSKEVNLIASGAKEKGATVVGITQNNGSPLSNLVDYLLPVPSEENEFRLGAITSRNSTQIITDLIYLGIIRHQVQKSSDYLVESRKAIYQLYKK